MLIFGRDWKECAKRVAQVLERSKQHKIRVNQQKCKFFESKVQYLGHEIDEQRLYPSVPKVEAIVKAPNPSNLTELKAFLRYAELLRAIPP